MGSCNAAWSRRAGQVTEPSWPMINIYNKHLGFGKASKPGLLDGVLPVAPVNRLAMLRDYIDPAKRAVACPNR